MVEELGKSGISVSGRVGRLTFLLVDCWIVRVPRLAGVVIMWMVAADNDFDLISRVRLFFSVADDTYCK